MSENAHPGTLTATVDQLQAELDQLHRELTIIVTTLALTILLVGVLYVRARHA